MFNRPAADRKPRRLRILMKMRLKQATRPISRLVATSDESTSRRDKGIALAYAGASEATMTLRVGDKAPEIDERTHDGEQIRTGDLLGEKVVVLYFYPKDETPGCTAEACSFRDAYEDFVDAGAIVVGVSADSLGSHEQFARHHRLPFKLISDEDGALRKAYDVPSNLFGLLPGRVTYVIDRKGTIRHVFNSQIQAKRHVKEALDVVRSLT
jgi:peroxiredoxin Q/BCP